MNNIDNQTIFLSSHNEYDKSCFIIEDESKSGIKSNSSYFSELTCLYIYDLKDRSISMFRPCPALDIILFNVRLDFDFRGYYFLLVEYWVEF